MNNSNLVTTGKTPQLLCPFGDGKNVCSPACRLWFSEAEMCTITSISKNLWFLKNGAAPNGAAQNGAAPIDGAAQLLAEILRANDFDLDRRRREAIVISLLIERSKMLQQGVAEDSGINQGRISALARGVGKPAKDAEIEALERVLRGKIRRGVSLQGNIKEGGL